METNLGKLVHRTEVCSFLSVSWLTIQVSDDHSKKVYNLQFQSNQFPDGLHVDVVELVDERDNCGASADPKKPCIQFWQSVIQLNVGLVYGW